MKIDEIKFWCFMAMWITWLIDYISTFHYIVSGKVIEANPINAFFLNNGIITFTLGLFWMTFIIMLVLEVPTFLRSRKVKYGQNGIEDKDEKQLIVFMAILFIVLELGVIIHNYGLHIGWWSI